ncbi:hypothetical protein [Streptomyces atratus]|uniref:hypothetical protein n=1 Tax=Streptomyces atratus TaxID=1893 RepID=UPI0022545025|nr:hypothetical protein [Streptomyces atratus]MCX5346006.1 hypothetical protein [Streptomyces atratus]
MACWVVALALPAETVFGDLYWAWSLFSLLLGLIGLLMWFQAVQTKEDTTRLQQSGRPAIAEITAAERGVPADGSADNSVLSLRISGADVPSFDAIYRCNHQERFQVGARFTAVVDPSDNLFTLRGM